MIQWYAARLPVPGLIRVAMWRCAGRLKYSLHFAPVRQSVLWWRDEVELFSHPPRGRYYYRFGRFPQLSFNHKVFGLHTHTEIQSNKYGTVQELCSTFNHINTINIGFSLVWFVSSYVDLWVRKYMMTFTVVVTNRSHWIWQESSWLLPRYRDSHKSESGELIWA